MGSIKPKRIGVAIAIAMATTPTTKACQLTKLATIPIVMANNVPLIPVEINGDSLSFILDTGAAQTEITPSAAESLSLPASRTQITKIRGVRELNAPIEPQTWYRAARYQRLRIGSMIENNGIINVAPVDTREFDLDVAGVIGSNIIAKHDLYLDIPQQKIEIINNSGCYENYTSWHNPYIATNAWSDPGIEQQLTLPVTVNNIPMRSILDTGASRSLITHTAADRAGIENQSTRSENRMTNALGQTITTYPVEIRSLTIGPYHFRNKWVEECYCKIDKAEFQIGEDFISRHKIWLSFNTGQVFIKQAEKHSW